MNNEMTNPSKELTVLGEEGGVPLEGGAFEAVSTPEATLSKQLVYSEPAYAPVSTGLLVGMVLFIAVLFAGVYWWRHSAENRSGESSPAQGSVAQPELDATKVEGMVKSLTARLKTNPADAAGWAMLARTYSVVGRAPEAVAAYVRAVELNSNDAALLIDYADALAVKNNRVFEGEPLKLLQRALKIDPHNIKGLAIAGKVSFDQKDYAGAVKQWEQVIRIGSPENLFVRQIQSELEVARDLANTPQRGATERKAQLGIGIRGTVSLASALASRVSPDDTVFVAVRALNGPRLPLVLFRKQVKDLPLSFHVDDSMAQSDQARISVSGKVFVTARISRSGNAMPQAGDLVGQIGPIDVGSVGLLLEIRDTYQP
jgi:cytochrome c-type biogenesis protein CcmH